MTAMAALGEAFAAKALEFDDIIKIGRSQHTEQLATMLHAETLTRPS